MSLHEWQTTLQRRILSPDASCPDTRIGIYRNAYRARLIEALRSNYPAVHRVLGDADFDRMAETYIGYAPSQHASIRWFGARLAEFLADHAPFNTLPILAELATFEWAVRHTLDAADRRTITAADLQAIEPAQWGALRFRLHPSISVLALQWNAPQVHKALTATDAASQDEMTVPLQQPMNWLVCRQPDLSCAWRSVSADEMAALDCLRSGGCFADICEQLLQRQDGDADDAEIQAAAQAATFLRHWVVQGILTSSEVIS